MNHQQHAWKPDEPGSNVVGVFTAAWLKARKDDIDEPPAGLPMQIWRQKEMAQPSLYKYFLDHINCPMAAGEAVGEECLYDWDVVRNSGTRCTCRATLPCHQLTHHAHCCPHRPIHHNSQDPPCRS